ncbi:MAG: hypothetical protein CFE25_17550 [Chitinophagaceae bacterium BSSC1]|nr:MAG: hypothetical protein CFE25_17550 [Chitinophagaceae bacterium BSSC1]
MEGFLKDCIKRFQYYKELGDKTLDQVNQEELHWMPSSESNSIALIIQHLHGNMKSRWTNFLTEDGEKPWRNRDQEFEPQTCTKAQAFDFWNQGWNCLLDTLAGLKTEDLQKTIYIRTEPLLVYDAILRQLAHYPYHVGQIVYIGRIIRNEQWKSLSIPKGHSQAFNDQMKNSSPGH